eukprot:gene13222-13353_t
MGVRQGLAPAHHAVFENVLAAVNADEFAPHMVLKRSAAYRFVQTSFGAAADKPAGVVALTCFDLRRLGKVKRLVLCDRCGTRMPAVRATMEAKIGRVYRGLDLSIDCFPDDDVADDPHAVLKAIGSMKPGDVAIIFTPDDTHFSIAAAAIEAGLHVLVAKPIVKTLQEHVQLVQLAKRHNVL